jgi:hypothetical protein
MNNHKLLIFIEQTKTVTMNLIIVL